MPLTRNFTDYLPDVGVHGIAAAFEQLSNGKAPEQDRVTSELLRAGGNPILEEPKRLFNSGLKSMITSKAWSRGGVALLHIKGDKRNIYQMGTISVQFQNHQKVQLLRGVRQGDAKYPKLFTNSLEDVFKILLWDGVGINVNGEYLTYLRFVDDILLMVESLQDVQTMLYSLNFALR